MDIFDSSRMQVLDSGKEDSLFEERESQIHHAPFQFEQQIIRYIRDGNVEMVRKLSDSSRKTKINAGKLSDDPLRQLQYNAVIVAYQTARVAIEVGLFEADMLNQSDAFIQKVDKETTPQRVLEMIAEEMIRWTSAIQQFKHYRPYSQPIRACMEHIHNHLHSRITLEELAKAACLSETYLSTLFVKEVGQNLSEYILRQKIQSAQDMLLHTQLSSKDIGFYLNFCSQSYFILCFKRLCGVTPKQYRLRRGVEKEKIWKSKSGCP